jgi:hypothetical protein
MNRDLWILQQQKILWYLQPATLIKKFANRSGDLRLAKPITKQYTRCKLMQRSKQ